MDTILLVWGFHPDTLCCSGSAVRKLSLSLSRFPHTQVRLLRYRFFYRYLVWCAKPEQSYFNRDFILIGGFSWISVHYIITATWAFNITLELAENHSLDSLSLAGKQGSSKCVTRQ